MSKIKKTDLPLVDRNDGYNWSDSLENNKLLVPSSIVAELEAKNYEYRWLNAKEMVEKRGLHRTGWKVYKVTNPDKAKAKGDFDFNNGVDVDGYVRRGDLVLGIKPKELQDRHRQKLKERNKNQDISRLQSLQARELRERAKDGGISDFSAYEGYDEN